MSGIQSMRRFAQIAMDTSTRGCGARMSDPVLIALIVTIPAVINAISALKLHQKVDDVKADVGTVKADVGTVKEEINGRMGELLKVTGESENAKGMLQG